MSTALITGGSRGLGAALATELAMRGWDLILDARTPADLTSTVTRLSSHGRVTGVEGDVTDPGHRRRLREVAETFGGVDLLVNNASTLGPSPLPSLDVSQPDDLRSVLEVNVIAPLALYQELAEVLADDAIVMNITSDAAVEAYPGWGLYGASKAALDQLTAVLGAERPDLRIYSVDPGDMRTQMHQDAFPGEDISDRPPPEDIVPNLLAIVDIRPDSGRLRAAAQPLATG